MICKAEIVIVLPIGCRFAVQRIIDGNIIFFRQTQPKIPSPVKAILPSNRTVTGSIQRKSCGKKIHDEINGISICPECSIHETGGQVIELIPVISKVIGKAIVPALATVL